MIDAVIVDCDGTLWDVKPIRHYLTGKSKNFHKFHRESVNCEPNYEVVTEVIEAYESGLTILIVTARTQRYWAETQFWLSENLPVPYKGPWMRRNDDFRKDSIVKKEILDSIRADGYNICKAWDDNPDVIELWCSEGIEVRVVDGFGYD